MYKIYLFMGSSLHYDLFFYVILFIYFTLKVLN